MRLQSIPIYTVAFVAAAVACTPESEDPQTWREQVGYLPTGVPVSVEISKPGDGEVVPEGPLKVSGFATIGETATVDQMTLAYVVDVSGSTDASGGCGGDLNKDGKPDTVLDCQISALVKLNAMAAESGSVSDVGLAAFGSSAATADLNPYPEYGLLTAPKADLDGDDQVDIESVLRSLKEGYIGLFTAREFGTSTSYGAGLEEIKLVLDDSEQPNKVVVMVSDGDNNRKPHIDEVLGTLPKGTVIHTFAVGAKSDCVLNLGPGDPNYGSLQEIADATGGTCTEIPDASTLPKIIPNIIAAKLVGLELRVDGALVPIDEITPALPQAGATKFDWSTTLDGLTPGEHELCATARGVDSLGHEDVTECVRVVVGSPPEAVCQDIVIAADGSCHSAASIDNGSFDPDGGDIECKAEPPGPYPLGTTEVKLTCTDSDGALSACDATVEVIDDSPPKVQAGQFMQQLWPVNHKYTEFSIYDCIDSIKDNCGKAEAGDLEIELLRVTSDETELGKGSGHTCEDIVIPHQGKPKFQVRAEREGGGNGRAYTAKFRVTDGSGNTTYDSCMIGVPASQNPKSEVIADQCALCVGYGCGACSTGDPACK